MTRSGDQLAKNLAKTQEPWRRRALLRQAARDDIDVDALLAHSIRTRDQDPSEAIPVALAAYLAARVGDDADAVARASRTLATTYLVVGQPLRALARLASVWPTAPARHRPSIARLRAQVLMQLGRFGEGLAILREARDELPRRGAAPDRGRLTLIEGMLHSSQGDAALAIDCFEQARRQLVRAKDAAMIPVIDVNRATAFTNVERYDLAERLYARGRAAFDEQGKTMYALQTAYNHAYLRFMRGFFHDALARFRDLRPQFDEAGDERHVALCDLDEAEINLHMNLPAHAARLAARAAEVFERLGMTAEAARAEFFWAVAARSLGRTHEAQHRLERAEATFRQQGNEMWWGICLHRLAELDAELGALARASTRAAEAAHRLRGCRLRERAGYAEVLRAALETRVGQDEAAERRLERLLEEIEGLRLPWLRCEIHHALARIHARRGNRGAAARHVLRATRLLERHRVAVPPDEYMAAFLTGKAALFQDAARMVLALGTASSPARAFELAEQARGRALLDLLRHQQPRPAGGRNASLEREVYRLEREIDGLGARLPTPERGARAEDAERRARAAARREKRLRACLDRVARVDPTGARIRRGAPPRFREVVQSLPSDVSLLEYFLAGDDLLTFLVSGGHLQVHRRALDRTHLTELLERTSFQLDRPNLYDRFDAGIATVLCRSASVVMRELHDLLLAPVREHLTTRRLVVVPHGDLNGIPFHALESEGRPLLLDHEVVQAPSASIYLHCGAARRRRGRTALLMGVPDETAPDIEHEIERLAELVPRHRRFVDGAATAEILARHGRRARLIHLATHARFHPEDPMESGVRLADGWLTIPRIADLRLQPDLLVLAGCATGRVSVTESGELFGLVRGFLQAGAASLLTSLWPVPDEETTTFMERFYGALTRGASPAGAQREAALALREEKAHPFHWAPFVTMGWGG